MLRLFATEVQSSSGNYWLQSVNGSAVYVYCDITLTCKGVSVDTGGETEHDQ